MAEIYVKKMRELVQNLINPSKEWQHLASYAIRGGYAINALLGRLEESEKILASRLPWGSVVGKIVSELKPCPFCGNKATVWIIHYKHYMAGCEKCEAAGPHAVSEREAKFMWNQRYTASEKKK